jgi:hypothetical protein
LPAKNATGISGYLFDNQQATVLIEPQQQPKWSPIHWMSKLAALNRILVVIRYRHKPDSQAIAKLDAQSLDSQAFSSDEFENG